MVIVSHLRVDDLNTVRVSDAAQALLKFSILPQFQ